MPNPDERAERAKAKLCDEISTHDGISRSNFFKGLVAPELRKDGTLVLVADTEEYANYVEKKWAEIFERRDVVVYSADRYPAATRSVNGSSLREEKAKRKTAS